MEGRNYFGLAGEGEEWVALSRRRSDRERLLRRMEALAEGRVNDAVKLAFLDGDQIGAIDGLDLTALTEFKRSGNGTVEIKLTDRMDALEKLIALEGDGESERGAAFFRALDERTGGGVTGGD